MRQKDVRASFPLIVRSWKTMLKHDLQNKIKNPDVLFL